MRFAMSLLVVFAVSAERASADEGLDIAKQVMEAKGAEIPDFDKIRTPDSPAFTLLGVSPTQIERPTTPKEFTAAISKFASEGDVVVPKNLAVEFSPFAIVSSYQKAESYLGRRWYQQLWQNATISAATATSSRDAAAVTHTDSTLGVGFRTMFALSGGPQPGCSDKELSAYVALAQRETTVLSIAGDDLQNKKADRIDSEMKNLGRQLTKGELDAIENEFRPQEIAIKQPLTLAAKDELASLCIKEIASAHRGWIMDVAVATGFTFPDSVADDGRYSLGAVWADIAYERSNISLVFVGRGRDDKTTGRHNYTSDVGVRGIIAKDAYAGSVEAIWRHSLSKDDGVGGDDDQYRIALALDVHISDGTWLTLSFGKDFAESEAGSLFSLANLKYGLGDPKVKR